MKRVWIVAPFSGIETPGVRNRFQYLANLLTEEGYEVTLYTSKFSHIDKKHVSDHIVDQYPFEVILVDEPGYQKNVSVRRAVSHLEFTKNLKKAMKKKQKPDLVYAAYPTMSAAKATGQYAKKNNIPFILDVQDTWPESLSSAINIDNPFIKCLLWPFTIYANSVYRMPDLVIGVSETYAQRANIKGCKSKEFIPVYIGAQLEKFDNAGFDSNQTEKNENEVWVTYIGTLSHSYDIKTAIESFKKLENKPNIQLHILGTGPDEEMLKKNAEDLNLKDKTVFFYGYMPYEKMVSVLKKSDIALNAIKGQAKQTITNKLGDYFSAGLPILNSCGEKEVIDLISQKELGLNYPSGDPTALKNAICEILKDPEKLQHYSKNSRALAEKSFDRKTSYRIIIEKIEELIR